MTMYRASLTSVIQEGHVCVHGRWGKFTQIEQRGFARLCLRQRLQTYQFALGGLGIQAALQELVPFQGFVCSGRSLSCEAPNLNSRAWVPIEECKEWKRSVVYQLLIYGEKMPRTSTHVPFYMQKEKTKSNLQYLFKELIKNTVGVCFRCVFQEWLCPCITLFVHIHLQNISFCASSAETNI